MFVTRISAIALVAILAAGCAGSADVRKGGEESGVGFQTLEKMVGDWAMVGQDGKPMPGLALSSHYSAGGSAIVETIFPGADHEMTSVYYADGDHVLMTHYCALGNAPHMSLEFGEDENTWIFTCDGHGTNFDESEMHMHRGEVTWLGKDRFKSSWVTHTDGKPGDPVEFEMVRVARAQ